MALAILCAPGFFQGCSGCTCEECFSHGVASQVRREAAQGYVYSAPIAETEREVRAYAKGQSFEVPDGAFTRSSRIVAPHTVSADRQLTFGFSPVGKDRYRLEVTQTSTYTAGDGGVDRRTSRELEGEWEIASRVDLEFAAKTNERAERSSDRAKTVGRGCDRGCELGCRACEACDRVVR